MGEVTWTAYETAANALTTGLNSLSDGAESAVGSEIDNTSDLDQFMDVYIDLASLNPTGTPYVVVNVYHSVDGTNYPGKPNAQYPVPTTAGSGAKHETLAHVPLTPGKTKLSLTNETNVAFASSGNTVKVRKYSPTVA